MMKTAAVILLGAGTCVAAERATYDSAGRITALIQDGTRLELLGHFVIVLADGRELLVQPHDQRSPIQRDGLERRWSGTLPLMFTTGARFSVAWTESESGVALDGKVALASETPFSVRSVDYVVDVPRDSFVGGHLTPGDVALPAVKPADAVFFRGTTDAPGFVDAAGRWSIGLKLDRARAITVSDCWEERGRFYRTRIPLFSGRWMPDQEIALHLAFTPGGASPAREAHLTLDANQPRQHFIGFGGNYCFNTTTPVVDYTLDQLTSAWVRFELKAHAWDAERDQPGEALRRDFELMRRTQEAKTPWILSLWRLPERYYQAPERGASPLGHGRRIAAEHWDEFVDLVGSYLVHLKKNYGAEPDLFSFNESDLGVDVIFTPEGHRDLIKALGRQFAKLGLKTRLLLGDSANPRDRLDFVLPATADAEAMSYLGAVSFHSWGGATNEQYAFWGDLAEWLHLPLMVGEAGFDPSAWRNRAYDSFDYGLREIAQHFDFLRYARPQISLYWQFTADYGLVRVRPDGSIEPTARFWMMKHLANLTPRDSEMLTTASDAAEVRIAAFGRGGTFVVHVLNTGAACRAQLGGLPAGPWQVTTTSEEVSFQQEAKPLTVTATGEVVLEMPARCFVTLVRAAP